jgi:hypothetical protein
VLLSVPSAFLSHASVEPDQGYQHMPIGPDLPAGDRRLYVPTTRDKLEILERANSLKAMGAHLERAIDTIGMTQSKHFVHNRRREASVAS